jgi:hypothetical protein
MTAATALLTASWLAVRRVPLLAPTGAAVLLVVLTWPWQDTGTAIPAMNGLAILLACAVAGTIDDPASEIAAASRYPRRTRVAARLAVGLAIVVPVYLAGALVAQLRFAPTPQTLMLLEAVGYAVAAVAIGAGLLAWRAQFMPSYAASVGLLGVALATYLLPREWAMVDAQTWGPPWTAAVLRWTALIIFALGILGAALRDPALAGRRRASHHHQSRQPAIPNGDSSCASSSHSSPR